MTVSSTTYKNTYSGDNATIAFAFNFQIKDASHLLVQLVNNSGTVLTQLINIDYTVTGTGNTSGLTDYTSGTVTFVTAPANNYEVIIKRSTPLTQVVDYRENDNFPADTHEGALDKLTLIVQDMQEQLDRCFKLEYTGEDSTDFSLPDPVANYYLRFNGTATALEAVANTGTIGLDHVHEDPSPELGGNLDVNGNSIVSSSSGNIIIEPNNTGEIRLNAATITVEDDIQHAGDSNTKFTFGTDTITATVGGVSVWDLSTLGIRFNGTGNRILNILDEDTLVSNSDTALPTQQSVKAYGDNTFVKLATPLVAGDLDMDGYSIITNDSNESITINPHGSGSIVLTADTGGVVNLDSATVRIHTDIEHAGDTNNKITFGTDTQTFTTGGTSRLDISDSGVRIGTGTRVTTILDEDTMSSDSATAIPTQQSVKAYVDNKAATQSDLETGTSTTVYTSPGRQHYHMSAAKFWVAFDGDAGTGAIFSDYNVSSITDSGTSNFTVNIENDMSNTNFSVFITGLHATSSLETISAVTSKTAGTVVLRTAVYSAGSIQPFDATEIYVAGFGDL